jgi:hypothetical protein
MPWAGPGRPQAADDEADDDQADHCQPGWKPPAGISEWIDPARTAKADTSTVSTATPVAIDVMRAPARGGRICGTRCIEPDRAMCAILRAWAVR